jgi:CxxC motif-containing protein (DUF1111 family)
MKSQITAAAVAAIVSGAGGAFAVQAARAATDPGVRNGAPGAGSPVSGLSADQTTLFFNGQKSFAEVEQLGDGLGPRFNLDSCMGCHAQPAPGGSAPPVNPQIALATAFGARNGIPSFISADGPVREVRFKFSQNGARDGGVHSLFVTSGRIDTTGSAQNCNIAQDDFNGNFARGNVGLRIPTPTFGTGLLESITDATLTGNLAANGARKQSLGISGHFNRSGNDGSITKFGWKAQNVSLLVFSGEAYNVEMGITNEAFPVERDQTAACQSAATPNDITGKEGIASAASTLSDVEQFADFMRLLGPPMPSSTAPGGAASIARGRAAFSNVGCDLCHTPTLMTGNASVKALANQRVNAYSDLAVHRMGPRLADNIQQGAAAGDEFRTAPLWGLGQRIFFLHDGRTTDLVQAIQAHASGGRNSGPAFGGSSFGPSEASAVINNYNNLSDAVEQDLLNFLRSL